MEKNKEMKERKILLPCEGEQQEPSQTDKDTDIVNFSTFVDGCLGRQNEEEPPETCSPDASPRNVSAK